MVNLDIDPVERPRAGDAGLNAAADPGSEAQPGRRPGLRVVFG